MIEVMRSAYAVLEWVLLGGAALLAFGLPRQAPAEDRPEPRLRWPLMVAVLFFVLFRGLTIADPAFLIGADEYCRVQYALHWAKAPFFAPEDHVWLPGQFYVLGAVQAVLGSPRHTVHAVSLLLALATIALAARAALRLWRSERAAGLAGILVGAHWVVVWASANPMAENFLWPCLLGALGAFVVGRQRDQAGEAAAADRADLAVAAWLGAGTLFRYEAWYAGVLFGAFLAARATRRLLTSTSLRGLGRPAFGMFLLALYPALWMAHGWLETGSALTFLDRTRELNVTGNHFYDFDTPLGAFLSYPRLLLRDHKPFLGFAAAGLVYALTRRSRATRQAGFALASLLVLAMLISVAGGIGSHSRGRFPLFFLLLALVFAAGAIEGVFARAARAGRLAVVAAVSLLVMLSGARALLHHPQAPGTDATFLGLLSQLERQGDASRDGARLLQAAGGGPLWMLHGEQPVELWMAWFHGGGLHAVRGVRERAGIAAELERAPAGTRILLRAPRPEGLGEGRRLRLVQSAPPYEVWEARDADAGDSR